MHDTELVRWFVAHGANPNVAAPNWPSPMVVAASRASQEVLEILVQYGGRVYPGNAFPAAAKTSLPDRTHILTYLLEQGAPIDMMEYEFDMKTFRMYSPMEFGTALHYASKRGNEQLVRFLLERGAETSIKDSVGKTALQYAQERNHSTVITLFEEFSVASS